MNKKRYIVLLIIIITLFILIYFLVAKDNIKKGNEKTTLIVGNQSVWSYASNKWTKSSKEKELFWTDFILYDDNEKLGTFKVWKDDDKWHYFDNDKSEQKVVGKTIAYSSNRKITVDKYEEENLTDNDNNINFVLKENNISLNTNFSSRYKIKLDYDHDNIEEEFYLISNAFIEDNNINQIFSIAFMVKDEKLYYLYKSIDSNTDFYNGCKPYYNYFIDLMDDETDEIIFSCSEYSNSNNKDMLYQFQNDKKEFKILVSN